MKNKINLNQYCDFCYDVKRLYPVLLDPQDPETELLLCKSCEKSYRKTEDNMKKIHKERVYMLRNTINGFIDMVRRAGA